MNYIIAISGKQGSGKTTLANNLMSFYNPSVNDANAIHMIFAETLYNIHDYVKSLMEFRGIPMKKKEGELLQMLGTEWGRKVKGEDVWVNCLLGQINNLHADNKKIIISDMRFRNEFNGLGQNAFKVRLEASELIRKSRCDGWRDNTTHQSEIDLDFYAKMGWFNCYLDTEADGAENQQHLLNCFYNFVQNGQTVDHEGFTKVKEKYYDTRSDALPDDGSNGSAVLSGTVPPTEGGEPVSSSSEEEKLR